MDLKTFSVDNYIIITYEAIFSGRLESFSLPLILPSTLFNGEGTIGNPLRYLYTLKLCPSPFLQTLLCVRSSIKLLMNILLQQKY